jgi:cyclophilin family peptidyl-prolyl cis-trans isomerase
MQNMSSLPIPARSRANRFPSESAAPGRLRLAAAGAVLILLAACSHAPAQKNETAPATFRVNFDTTKGPVVIEVTRDLAPFGADRFYSLVKAKYFDGARFFRVVPGFVVQWGIAASPELTKTWDTPIQDDPVKTSNARGTVTFAAASQPNSRSTQLFINLADNSRLDAMGFAPFGKVVSGMESVDQINPEYGENPDQSTAEEQGNSYFETNFPKLDYIRTARLAQ